MKYAVALVIGLGLLLAPASARDPAGELYWILLKPRPAVDASTHRLTPRAVERLTRMGQIPQACDLPVWQPWVAELEARGVQVRARSRWMHAVSARLSRALVASLSSCPFVRGLRPIHPLPVRPRRLSEPVGPGVPCRPSAWGGGGAGRDTLLDGSPEIYGASYGQLAMLGIPELHARGLSGEGILIAVLDSGFHTDHGALSGLDLVAEHDFVYDDDQVQNGDRGDEHGTLTLTALGGYLPGDLVGPAYRASYILARSEEISFEKRIEEEYFVEALEWADAMGADLVSASLGYRDFPDEEGGPWEYPYADLDGETTVTTRGVNQAARRGMLVVSSAGNEGPGARSLLAPGDSDSALAVGAVYPTREVTEFSSRGPTADGRVKPDLCGQGDRVVCGRWRAAEGAHLSVGRGTSLAAPLVAGLAALILEAEPALAPVELCSRLRAAGDRAGRPDSVYGHGIPWGPLALDSAAAVVVIDSLRWSGEPQLLRSSQLEIHLLNVGRTVAPEGSVTPEQGTPGVRLEEVAQSVPALAVGEGAWVGSWDVWIGAAELLAGRRWITLVFGGELGRRGATATVLPADPGDLGRRVALVQVTPNPWVGRTPLLLDYVHPDAAEADVDLFDASGRRLVRLGAAVHVSPGGGALTMSADRLGALPAGHYYLRLRSHAGSAYRSVVRLH